MTVQQQNQPPLFEVKKALGHGVTNPIVARLTLQTMEMLEKTALPKEARDKVNGVFMSSLVQKLLRCWEIEQRLRAEWEKSVANFEPPGRGAAAVGVPQNPALARGLRRFSLFGQELPARPGECLQRLARIKLQRRKGLDEAN
jgi:hypothetical protein